LNDDLGARVKVTSVRLTTAEHALFAAMAKEMGLNDVSKFMRHAAKALATGKGGRGLSAADRQAVKDLADQTRGIGGLLNQVATRLHLVANAYTSAPPTAEEVSVLMEKFRGLSTQINDWLRASRR
jgi:hypothetical protein